MACPSLLRFQILIIEWDYSLRNGWISIDYGYLCEKFNNNKYEHYAARFAAKEAVYKALSNYDDLDWKDIEINNQDNGRPYVNLMVKIPDLKQIDITLSHCKTYATAYVVATFD